MITARAKITKKNNVLDIVDDSITNVYMENGLEIVEPSNFNYDREKIIKEIMQLNQLKKFTIVAVLVGDGRYNKITDKKGIWGLTAQSEGLYENSFLSSNGKIYFGITDKEINIQGSVIYYTFEIFIPKNIDLLYDQIFNVLLAERELLFSSEGIDHIMTEIVKLYPESIVISNNYLDHHLKICSKDINQFTDKILLALRESNKEK